MQKTFNKFKKGDVQEGNSETRTGEDRKIESIKQIVETSPNPTNINGSLFKDCQSEFSLSPTHIHTKSNKVFLKDKTQKL